MNTKVTYLVSIFIGTPTEQHAKIKDIAARVSDDDYEFLHLHKMGAFLVLNSDKSANALTSAFVRPPPPRTGYSCARWAKTGRHMD